MLPQKFIIFSDSRSAIEALKSYYPTHTLVQQIKVSLHKLYESGVNVEICWIPAHVDIKGNEDADKAAKEASTMISSNINIPINDYLTSIKSTIMNKWQNLWNDESDNNKLKQIKPMIGLWPSSVQKERHIEVVLCRLRIGHTRLTHGHLMNTPHDPIPECNTCNTIMTVKHIFCDCPVYTQQRMTSFGQKSLKEVLSESPTFSVRPLIRFLRSCDLLNKI